MTKRAQEVINRLYEGQTVRDAISETLSIRFRADADELMKDSKVKGFIQKKDFNGLYAYLNNEINTPAISDKMSRKELRYLARDLIYRGITGSKG